MHRRYSSSGLGAHWRAEVLRTNLWLVPAIEVVAAIVLFAITRAWITPPTAGSSASRRG